MTFKGDLTTAVENLDVELLFSAEAGGDERIDSDKTLVVVAHWTGVAGSPDSYTWFRSWRLDCYAPTYEEMDEIAVAEHGTALIKALRPVVNIQSVVRGSNISGDYRYFFINLREKAII